MTALQTLSVDWVVFKFRGQVQDWRIQSFENYVAFSMSVRRLSQPDHKSHARYRKTTAGYSTLVVNMWNMSPRTICVKIDSEQMFHVVCAGRWVPLTEWLDQIKVELSLNADYGYGFHHQSLQYDRWAEQQEWWDKNGKFFRFLRLPSELREMVYDLIIPSTIVPYLQSKNRTSSREFMPTWSQYPFMPLITASKQIYLESSRVLQRRPFRAETERALTMLLNRKDQRDRLSRLEIALSHRDFAKAFGLHPAYKQPRGSLLPRPIRHLQTMTLQQITIDIAPPAVSTGTVIFDGACQVDVVGFLFVLMWYWIRGQSVVITGYVKDSQREMFEKHCRDEARLFVQWHQIARAMDGVNHTIKEYYYWQEWLAREEDGGVGLDGGKTVPEVKKVIPCEFDADDESSDESSDDEDDESPAFPCSCIPRCAISTWTNKDAEELEADFT